MVAVGVVWLTTFTVFGFPGEVDAISVRGACWESYLALGFDPTSEQGMKADSILWTGALVGEKVRLSCATMLGRVLCLSEVQAVRFPSSQCSN